ncbi:hypothetical protein Pan241w_20430 [Gimesia alba]|uniref:Oxidative stress defense protein n=1 Tax=Gimesia alba TaxID=2527973 RepID=A0A517RDN7_9PLAN|nr:SIMPL domain-containing protein [Gimesia alba]QDT41963.1 hypothetical protein Pan241w_20430 [Gimesia alba]
MNSMMIRTLLVVLLCTTGKPAFSQFGGSGILEGEAGTVSGNGTVVIKKTPAVMRMQIDLLSKASSLKEALAGLKERIEATRAQLAAFGADKASIKLGEPKLSAGKSDRQQQMEALLLERMKSLNRGKTQKKNAPTSPVTVSVQLSVEWKLKAKTVEELLLTTHPLQKKIKDADLGGLKAASKLSPEEQEIMEEMGERAMYGGDGEAKPGEPVFSFASPISQEEEDKALAEAFQKARSQASRLSKAAGYELGKLNSISSDAGSSGEENEYGYRSAYYSVARSLYSAENSEDSQAEAVSVLPKQVKYHVTVTAGFELKEK